MKCVKCYREIADGLKFCTKCGAIQPEDREAYEREHPELADAEPELEEENIMEVLQKVAYVPNVAMSRNDFVRFVDADPQRDRIIQMADEGVVSFGFFEKAVADKWYSKCAELIDDKLGFYPYFVKLLSQGYEKARKLLFSQAVEGMGVVASVKQKSSNQVKPSVSSGNLSSAAPQKSATPKKSAAPVTSMREPRPSPDIKSSPAQYQKLDSKPRESLLKLIVPLIIALAVVMIVGKVLLSQCHKKDDITDKSVVNSYADNIEVSPNDKIEASSEEIEDAAANPNGEDNVVSESGERIFCVGDVLFSMMPVEGGSFTMGATREQAGDSNDDEIPTHSVTLSSYYIGQTEVTQELWMAVMGSNPSKYKGAKRPVDNVSWENCQEFLGKLNEKTGMRFRLPTEAEWEFAARGGNKSRGYKYSGGNNISEVAWYHDNSGGTSHNVGTKRANELGLYDMSGNVCEWCSDWYGDYDSSSQSNPQGPDSGSTRAFRGGTWYYLAKYCRVSYRHNLVPGHRYYLRGLRLAL